MTRMCLNRIFLINIVDVNSHFVYHLFFESLLSLGERMNLKVMFADYLNDVDVKGCDGHKVWAIFMAHVQKWVLQLGPNGELRACECRAKKGGLGGKGSSLIKPL
ncbi:hypothetical protein L1887_30425 [Cichorium endivia]|nr:hypothetical protein L1887_30425 [Cichorium endivia]